MGRRVACIFLPEVRLELVLSGERLRSESGADGQHTPIAIVVARRGGAVKLERDILGNTRLDVVSSEARSRGIRPGQTVSAARAKHAGLRVRVVAEEDVQMELARVAEAALSFGPATGFDAAQDVVWVDVGGCAHLKGGEIELARSLEATVRGLGHACRVAIADGPRVAAAVARFGRDGTVVVTEGKSGAAMRGLPISALGLDPDVTAWLRDLGLRRCGDLQRLPRRSLGARLGDRVLDVMQLLDGEDRSPLVAWRPPEVPEERVSLDWGVSSFEALAFVLKTLCDRLADRLERRAMAASRLELVLTLDKALCGRHVPGSAGAWSKPGRHVPGSAGAWSKPGDEHHLMSFHVVLPSPLVHAGELLAVLRARLENQALAAPALTVTLRAPELVPHAFRALDLLVPEPRALRALPRLVAELGAELGEDCVGTLALVDTWVPEERTRLMKFGVRDVPSRHSLVTSALEATRLSRPDHDGTSPASPGRGRNLMTRTALSHVSVLARLEGIAWWRRPSGRTVDLVSAWVGSKHGGALAWVELRKDGTSPAPPGRGQHKVEVVLRGWID
jgi:protein ImuB